MIPFKEHPTASATQQSFATDAQASDALSQWMNGRLKPISKSKTLILDILSSCRGRRYPGHDPLSGKVLHFWTYSHLLSYLLTLQNSGASPASQSLLEASSIHPHPRCPIRRLRSLFKHKLALHLMMVMEVMILGKGLSVPQSSLRVLNQLARALTSIVQSVGQNFLPDNNARR